MQPHQYNNTYITVYTRTYAMVQKDF